MNGRVRKPTDAELAIDLVLRHRDRFKPLKPQSVEIRTLIHLVQKRRRLVEDRLRFSNRLTSINIQSGPSASRSVFAASR